MGLNPVPAKEIEKLLALFANKHPEFKMKSPDEKNQLMNVLRVVLTNHVRNSNSIDRSPKAMLKLVNVLDGALKLNKNKEVETLVKVIEKFLKDNNLIKKDGSLDKEKLLALDPKKLNELKLTLKTLGNKLLTDLKLTPQNKKDKLADELTNRFINNTDKNTNLLGLICTSIAGGYAALVECFLGNLNSVVDASPEHGYAQIDEQDRAFSGDASFSGAPVLAQELLQGLEQSNNDQPDQPYKSPNPFNTKLVPPGRAQQ